ncbi:hypothetical protein ACHAWF_000149 [Thalassiosira exigua]
MQPNGGGAVRDRALSPGRAPASEVFGRAVAVVRRRRGDDGVGGKVTRAMKELIRVGPMFGYHPEPNKSWVIFPLGSKAKAKAKAAFEAEGLQTAGVEALAKIAVRYPQSAYKGRLPPLELYFRSLVLKINPVSKVLSPCLIQE